MNSRLLRSNVIGVGRSLLAASTFFSLALNDPRELFQPFGEQVPYWSAQFSLFRVLPDLQLARALACAALILVVIGYRPRITAVVHWYVTFSYAQSSFIAEGGDSLASILCLMLIPVLMFDGRKFHWTDETTDAISPSGWAEAITSVTYQVIRVQMCIVYLQASVGKMVKPEWASGTAIYYWLQHPVFGPPAPFSETILWFLDRPLLSFLITWGVMLLELALASGLVIERRYRTGLFWLGIGFHFAIFLVHGLGTFGLAMGGALVLYLRDPLASIPLPRFLQKVSLTNRHSHVRLNP